MATSTKGFAVPAVWVLYLGAAALATQLVPNWRISHLVEKRAPMSDLVQARKDLEKAKADAAAAERVLKEAQELREQKQVQEVRAAQQTNEGAVEALKRVPAQHRTAEVKLAQAMALRTSLRLAAAIGKLPQDQQDEILAIVDQALSDKQAEVDEANRRLAALDADFKRLDEDKKLVEAKIPTLQKKVEEKDAKLAALQQTVADKTTAVLEYATKLEQKERERGSLSGIVADLWWKVKVVAVVAAVFYVTFWWILPGVIKHMATGSTKTTLRNVVGYVTNPLLFHDAKVKLAELAATARQGPTS